MAANAIVKVRRINQNCELRIIQVRKCWTKHVAPAISSKEFPSILRSLHFIQNLCSTFFIIITFIIKRRSVSVYRRGKNAIKNRISRAAAKDLLRIPDTDDVHILSDAIC